MDNVVTIELTGSLDFNAKPRVLTPKEDRAFTEWFQEAIKNQWIEPSSARHSCGFMFVPKRDSDKLRFVVNYRRLNDVIKTRVYAPTVGIGLRQQIARARWYSKIDLKDAFYHMSIASRDRYLTTFWTPRGLMQFRVLPNGLKSAPGEFQLYIERILSGMIGQDTTVHIDDILVYALTREGCRAKTLAVSERLHTHKVVVNTTKSEYLSPTIRYCGYEYGNGQISPIDRTETIDEWPVPRNKREVQSFTGFCNHYMEHAIGYGGLAAPLYEATGKTWVWKDTQAKSFEKLKMAMHNLITTNEHDRWANCTITTDASQFGVGAVLTQKGRITAITSRGLNKAERNYGAPERELLAVVLALEKWIYLLEEAPKIRVCTDSLINTSLREETPNNRRRNRWLELFGRYTLVWVHIAGTDNPADMPSRRPDYKVLRRLKNSH